MLFTALVELGVSGLLPLLGDAPEEDAPTRVGNGVGRAHVVGVAAVVAVEGEVVALDRPLCQHPRGVPVDVGHESFDVPPRGGQVRHHEPDPNLRLGVGSLGLLLDGDDDVLGKYAVRPVLGNQGPLLGFRDEGEGLEGTRVVRAGLAKDALELFDDGGLEVGVPTGVPFRLADAAESVDGTGCPRATRAKDGGQASPDPILER